MRWRARLRCWWRGYHLWKIDPGVSRTCVCCHRTEIFERGGWDDPELFRYARTI